MALPMATSPLVIVPACLSKLAFAAYSILTGFGAGEPLGDSLSLSQVTRPTALAWLPFELIVPSRFARPPIPLAASMKPEVARSMLFTFNVASRGVLDKSCGLIGPAFPVRFAFPPPGRPTLSLRGNWDVYEKFVTSTFTLSYTWFFFAELALPTISLPSLISTLPTEKFWAAEAPDFSGSGAFFPPVV